MDETDPTGYEPSGASASASQKVGVARAARRGARRHISILRLRRVSREGEKGRGRGQWLQRPI